jgi:succinyl-CoA synthetase alpha subunit
MAIIVDEKNRVIVQGITGREGAFHTKKMLDYGTKIVAGVTPGKGGTEIYGIPVFNTVKEAVKRTRADTTIIFVPPTAGADAVMEAIDAGIKTIVCITDGIPLHDELKICRAAKNSNVNLIGPNTPGVISPGKVLVGIIPPHIFIEGNVGIVSRSGSLMYQIAYELTKRKIGQSTAVGVGGDRVIGFSIVKALQEFEKDHHTECVVLIGEIGGSEENRACEFIKEMSKPVVAYIAGITAPPEKRMGHAGAIVERGVETAESKIKDLRLCGAIVCQTLMEVAEKVEKILKR